MGESSNEGLELCKVLVHTLPPGNCDMYLGLFCQSLQFIFQVADIVPLYSFINTIKCAVGERWVFQNKTCQVSSFLERFSPSNWKKKAYNYPHMSVWCPIYYSERVQRKSKPVEWSLNSCRSHNVVCGPLLSSPPAVEPQVVQSLHPSL